MTLCPCCTLQLAVFAHPLLHFHLSQKSSGVRHPGNIVPNVHMKKLRLRKGKQIPSYDTSSKGWCQGTPPTKQKIRFPPMPHLPEGSIYMDVQGKGSPCVSLPHGKTSCFTRTVGD